MHVLPPHCLELFPKIVSKKKKVPAVIPVYYTKLSFSYFAFFNVSFHVSFFRIHIHPY